MSEHPTHGPDAGHLQHHNTQEFWDERYAGSDRVWSGNPNARLVEHVSDLAPATAVDVGCGEGADAVWLARRGWQVTGVDVSRVALDKTRQHAEEAGVAARVDVRRVDLLAGDPLPQGDLVAAHFFHVPPSDFERVYRAIAAAVRPGGTLLVVGHHPDHSAALHNPELGRMLFTAEEVAALLDPADWDLRAVDAPVREGTDRDGRPTTFTDAVVVAVRR